MSFDRLRFPKDFDLAAGSAPCSLDSVEALDATLLPLENGAVDEFPAGCRIRFDGWAVAPVLGGYRIPQAVFLRVGDTGRYLHAATGIGREDVARDMRDANLTGSGFRGLQTLDDVALGRHALSLAVVGERGTYFEAPLRRSIVVVESRRQFPVLPHSGRTVVGATSLEAMHGRQGGGAKARFVRGTIVVARGEAVERDTQRPASRVFAIVDGVAYFGGIAGLPNERGERSAFTVRVPTRGLSPGKHVLRIAAIASDASSFSLGVELPFVLRGA